MRFKPFKPEFAILSVLSFGAPALASPSNSSDCSFSLLRSLHSPSAIPDGIARWLDWETTPVIQDLTPEFKTSAIPMSWAPLKEVEISKSLEIPSNLEKSLIHGDRILWPKHPYNTVASSPFFHSPLLPEKLKGYHTASRSMVTTIDGRFYGIKMPTNHPFGPNRVEQINKAFPKDSMRSSMRRTEIIEKTDARIGKDPDLILLRDVFTATEKSTGTGFAIRDLSPMEDGHYYFPAHLLPVEGPALAARNQKPFGEFVRSAWAEPLGKVQAKLLIRYGMEYNPINPQNFLIQLDQNLNPTGRLACRDLGDAFQVESISRAIGLGEEAAKDRASGLKVFDAAAPSTKAETLAWGFNLTSKELILPVTRNSWMDGHDEAFIGELERLLGVKVPKGYGAYAIDHWLKKQENIEALARFHRPR